MNAAAPDDRTVPDRALDGHSLESLAASLLCDVSAPPPTRVHDSWRSELAAVPRLGRPGRRTGRGGPDAPGRRHPNRAALVAAASVAVLALAGVTAIMAPNPGGEAGEGPSSSEKAVTPIELTSLGPAVGGAMGERDLGGLADPGRAAACLTEHGEDEADLLGAAPVTVDGRVRQLFVLSTGIPGRVTVLLTVNACGSRPAAPLVHYAIGTPG